ncbi:Protein-Associating With The Carboxyl-Terminal Domain Of Ezrin [Manis pentadactyla]|nr:Protein-Associating With The Carboxyl-Terminal Domain Of Ezrin [Manis pentadactyla]
MESCAGQCDVLDSTLQSWDSASHAGIEASGNPNSAAREASGGRTAPVPGALSGAVTAWQRQAGMRPRVSLSFSHFITSQELHSESCIHETLS